MGSCRIHIGGRALVNKVLREGYYWPNLRGDAMELVKKCDKCQRVGAITKRNEMP